ncbi:GTP-binding protein [Niallia sp. NCCP-28]|uniref:CobW family GTP-binding protein n=1 Tax=Niallia sp. NCCP-28 TaxID=2934712 RepID=UPI002086A8D2|nr:CobW family GTP-binding protein [Niallia sp. NCCP-28]GKU80866.1 cobalamin biosynthesis protein [Niallia sp. NCCP-28]
MHTNKTEIYILSGFLGSGKTTLLKELLIKEKKADRKVAVLMNEFGSISIDSNEVDKDIPLKELLGGCVCCTIQDKLEAQLQTLLIEENPDVIYLETTGAAHPVETIDTILSPLLAHRLQLKGIITVVDGLQWLNRRELSPVIQQLLLEQVRHANLLIINKQDKLTEEQKARITMEVQGINPFAPALLTDHSKIPYSKIQNIEAHFHKEIERTTIQSMQLTSYIYTFKKKISFEKFDTFLRLLPETIYRIKGYVQFENSAYPDLFQYSYGTPIFMKEEMNLPLNMVFIGENIDWKEIEQKLERL